MIGLSYQGEYPDNAAIMILVINWNRANLSRDYFTNRQDRYYTIRCSELCEYLFSIQKAIGSLSYSLSPCSKNQSGFVVDWPSTNLSCTPVDDPTRFRRTAKEVLVPLVHYRLPVKEKGISMAKYDTRIYPLLQFTPLLGLDKSTEWRALSILFDLLNTSPFSLSSSWTFTTAYFSVSPSLQSAFLRTESKCHGTIITAAPEASGFFGSKELSSILPLAYKIATLDFMDLAIRDTQERAIDFREWRRGIHGQHEGWTYHAKGFWVGLEGGSPDMTIIGSSNFGHRSHDLDLELDLLIITGSLTLRAKMENERRELLRYTRGISSPREEWKALESVRWFWILLLRWALLLGGWLL